MDAAEVFIILLVTGLMLVGAEVFVPGGIMGTIGALSLIAASAVGFRAFPGYGPAIAIGIVILVGIVIALWIKFFPRSRIGRQMTVERDLVDAKATQNGLAQLVGKSGEALSPLRPAGFAKIDGRRIDVVTQGESIQKGTPVVVVEVEGNRVVVRKSAASAQAVTTAA